MKKKFLAVISAVAAACICACAFSACGDGSDKLVYEPIDEFGKTIGYSVTGTTDKYGIKKANIPAEYNGYPVTEIGEQAFAFCLKLSSITIPASIKKIGDNAFSDCKALSKVNYTGDIAGWCGIQFKNLVSNPVFQTGKLYINNELLTEAVIPEGVTQVNNYAFYKNTSIVSISLPDSLTGIGMGAFEKCSGLESLTIPKNVGRIQNEAFAECVSLKEINFNATACFSFEYKNYVFSRAGQNGDGITVTIGANVGRIPNYLFCPKDGGTVNGVSCVPKITSVVFEDNSKCVRIGDSAFRSCSDITSIKMPSSLKIIDDYAFMFCLKISNLTIPATVTSIGKNAFVNCSKKMQTVFESTNNWAFKDEDGKTVNIPSEDLQNPATATEYLLQPGYSFIKL